MFIRNLNLISVQSWSYLHLLCPEWKRISNEWFTLKIKYQGKVKSIVLIRFEADYKN